MAAAPFLTQLGQMAVVKAFLQGVTPAVLGAMVAATLPWAWTTFRQPTLAQTLVAWGIGAVALVALMRFRCPTWQLVLGGAAAGLMLGLLT